MHDEIELERAAAIIVAAYLSKNQIDAHQIPVVIDIVKKALVKNGNAEPAPQPDPDVLKRTPAQIRKSVTPEYLVSFENGKRMKLLKRHLTSLGISPDEYRAKWGLPQDYPMVAPKYAARRSDMAKKLGLGLKQKA